MSIDFIQNPKDYYVYIKTVENNIVFLVIYVDDILLDGNDISLTMEVKQRLIDKIEMKDCGEASYILGIKILKNKTLQKLNLSQETYINSILSRFNMHNCSEGYTPYDKRKNFSL